MDKHAEVHPYNGILSAAKRNMDESQMHSAKWKKLDSKGCIQPDSIYILGKRQNYRDKEQISGC